VPLNVNVFVKDYAKTTRTCRSCRTVWSYGKEVEGFSNDIVIFDEEGVEKEAYKNLELQKEKLSKDCEHDVLCPQCGHFAVETYKKYFSKGFIDGIEEAVFLENTNLVLAILGGIILASGLGYFLNSISDSLGAFIFGVAVNIIIVCVGIYEIYKFVVISPKLKRVLVSEKQAEDFALWAVGENGNVLDGAKVFKKNVERFLKEESKSSTFNDVES